MSGREDIFDTAANTAFSRNQAVYPPIQGDGQPVSPHVVMPQSVPQGSQNDAKLCGIVRQWADRVIAFSSQYNTGGWSAESATGAPRVYPRYGDENGAWAQGTLNANQFIELSYPERLFITEINIYETYHCGGVKSVYIRAPSGEWATVWNTARVQCLTDKSRIFSIQLQKVQYRSNAIRLDIDCSLSQNWVEIDAVEMVGRKLPFDLPQPSDTVALHYRNYVNNQEFSDVTFKIKGQHLYAHRVMISARSAAFKQMMLNKSNANKPIELRGETVELFLPLLKYLYTNELDAYLQPIQVTKLWRVADRFRVNGLKALIILDLSNKLDMNNVIDIYVEAAMGGTPVIGMPGNKLPVIWKVRFTEGKFNAATLHSKVAESHLPSVNLKVNADVNPKQKHVKTMCVMYMSENMALISRSPKFTQLPHELMVDVIQKATGNL